MSTLKVDSIVDEAGSGAPEMPNGLTVGNTAIPTTGPLSNRNLIINGGFDVWQRGTSHTGAGYTSDRWVVSTGEATTAMTKTANRDERNTFRVTFGTTVSCVLDQRIEGFGNVGYDQPVTLSFWVRGSRATTGTDYCRIRNHTTSTTLETLYYDITTSWVKVVKTFSADATWSKDDVARLYLFGASASSPWTASDWVEFSDVQLEVGDTATPFEHRSYGDELARCQRYYQKLQPDLDMPVVRATASDTLRRATTNLTTTMRAAPTAAITQDTGAGTYSVSSSTNDAIRFQGTGNGATSVLRITEITADAEL